MKTPMRFADSALLAVVVAGNAWLPACGAEGGAGPNPEDRRTESVEFARAPSARRAGDKVEISFTVQAYCDVTVAIEDSQGRIVRHLASGLLGANPPPPFQKDALEQKLTWEGKDDFGRYVDNAAGCSVRISLGLKPRYEKNLFWHPQRRIGHAHMGFDPLLIKAAPEGVYVYQANPDAENIRLYDHAGNYLRTVYPFPADKVDKVLELPHRTYPGNIRVPAKRTYFLSTLLMGRPSGRNESNRILNSETTAMASGSGKLAVLGMFLNRLAADGSSGGLPVYGPNIARPWRSSRGGADESQAVTARPFQPATAAFSPDGKYLYLAGYGSNRAVGTGPSKLRVWLNAVYRMAFDEQKSPEPFIGIEEEIGAGNGQFNAPYGLAVDRAGRVYVADNGNDRVQIFSPEGKLLESLPVSSPVELAVHQRTGDIYVFSWELANDYRASPRKMEPAPTYRRFGPLGDLKLYVQSPLPLTKSRHDILSAEELIEARKGFRSQGFDYRVEVDTWADPPVIWLRPGLRDGPGTDGPLLLVERDGRLETLRDFTEDVRKAGVPLTSPGMWANWRLYADPQRGLLFLAESDCGTGKAFTRLVRIEPETGDCRMEELPFSPEDMAFGPDGFAYLRTGSVVVRFDPRTWREVPYDYGEERAAIQYSYDSKKGAAIGALVLPSKKNDYGWDLGGLDVNFNGDMVAVCFNPNSASLDPSRGALSDSFASRGNKDIRDEGKGYATQIYPGRWMSGEEVHVWDRHGQVKFADVLKGVPRINDGVAIDREGSVYAVVMRSALTDGRTPYYKAVGLPYEHVGTLVKVRDGGGKFLCASPEGAPVPLAKEARPDRAMDLNKFWSEGLLWKYTGVGRVNADMDCTCAYSRFALDYFARSFAPEMDRFGVAVVDSNGNFILRIGRYGNVDSSGPASPRPLGGDEVGLFHANFVATHTDQRLYIADIGNARIVSVKLEYFREARIQLKDVPEQVAPDQ